MLSLPLTYYYSWPPSLPRARNLALYNAIGAIILFLDDDMKVRQGLIQETRRLFQSHPGLLAAGGRLIEKKGISRVSASRPGGHLGKFSLSIRTDYTSLEESTCRMGPGGNMSFRKKLLPKRFSFPEFFRGSAHLEESFSFLTLPPYPPVIYNGKAAVEHFKAPSGGCRRPYPYWVREYSRHYGVLIGRFSKFLSPYYFLIRAIVLVKFLGNSEIGAREYFLNLLELLEGYRLGKRQRKKIRAPR